MTRTIILTVAALALAWPATAAEVKLEDLNLALVKQGWGTAQAGKSVSGLPMKMSGRTFSQGIGTHAPLLAVVQLDGQADRFRAVVGVNDTGRNEPGSVEFIVIGDGKPLFRSGILHGGDQPKLVDVALAGVRQLTLQVTDGGDNINSDHANWAEAVISYNGAKPELLDPDAEYKPLSLYPEKLTASPGNTTYRIGAHEIPKINALLLAAGDKVIIAPGVHHETLALRAAGTKDKPVVVEFAPGRHEFRAERAAKLCYFVSNSADAPLKPRPIGILIKNCRHVQITGAKGTEIWYGDRMTMFINDHAEDITYSGLTFDFVRPTVSEFRVVEPNIIQIAEGSTYQIENGRFSWTGDLGGGGLLVQEAIPATGQCWRRGGIDLGKVEDLGGGKLRVTANLPPGHQFHFRNTMRDTTSAVNTRCKHITMRDCSFYSLPGMGIVSQFTEDITYERVHVVPRPGTLRTCPAWADCLHFSGCRGDIVVDTCNFSGTQDDPVNCHGTHLRIVEKTGPHQVLVRFMQPQTYGIPAFAPGDKVEFVNHRTLRGYASYTVTALERKTHKDWLLTLAEPVAAFGQNDVVDNVSWYPNITLRNCTVTMDATRGFLITTRGKAIVEGCTFNRTAMAAILVEDDAEGWFESGPIRDLTIRNNSFIQCAGAIAIHPHNFNNDPALPVHENIRIENNFFDGCGISAKSTKGLRITGNRFTSPSLPVGTAACTDVVIESNQTAAKR
jgi:hypothetical protein